MIYIYGDSHASFSFQNLNLPNSNLYCNSITMFRIGRDNKIINFNDRKIKKGDVIILSYGEIDCRCHLQRQIIMNGNEDAVINELVNNYFKTIKNNIITVDIKIIIVGVIPPTKRDDYEKIYRPVKNGIPFAGTDEDRVRYTNKVNKLLEDMAIKHNYIYFNPYFYYTRDDGTLKHEFSDTIVHLSNNSFFLESFYNLYTTLHM